MMGIYCKKYDQNYSEKKAMAINVCIKEMNWLCCTTINYPFL